MMHKYLMDLIVSVRLGRIMLILLAKFVVNKIVFHVTKIYAFLVLQVSTCLGINAKNASPIVKYAHHHQITAFNVKIDISMTLI